MYPPSPPQACDSIAEPVLSPFLCLSFLASLTPRLWTWVCLRVTEWHLRTWEEGSLSCWPTSPSWWRVWWYGVTATRSLSVSTAHGRTPPGPSCYGTKVRSRPCIRNTATITWMPRGWASNQQAMSQYLHCKQIRRTARIVTSQKPKQGCQGCYSLEKVEMNVSWV